jgi:hypothetical protein
MAKDKESRQRGVDDSFSGRAAQLAVMAELLRLHCNTAIPEVDLGTDLFAFVDDREEIVRIQVKVCMVPHFYKDGSGYSAKFALPLKQLEQEDTPPIYYVLVVWGDECWLDFLVVSRARLQSYRLEEGIRFGSHNKTNDDLEITVEFRNLVTCSGRSLTDCRNAWQSLPPLR